MFKIGLIVYPAFITIKNGKPSGPTGNILYKSYRFLHNFTTFTALKRENNPLNYFSQDIDLPQHVGLLPYLNENVTNGPPIANENCFLVSNREKVPHEITSKFSDIFDYINLSALIAIITMNLLLLLMMFTICESKKLSQTISDFVSIFLRQKSVRLPKNSAKIIVACCAIFFYLTQLIALCYLKTEFVTEDKEIKIDSFDDVSRYGRSLYAATVSLCYVAFKFSIWSKNIHINPQIPFEIIERPNKPGVLRSNVAVLTQIKSYYRQLSCFHQKRRRLSSPIADDLYYFSKKPAMNFVRCFYFRKNGNQKLRKKISKHFHHQFQAAVFPDGEVHGKNIFQAKFGKKQDPACTDGVNLDDNYQRPLPISFFSELSVIYLLAVIIACIIFLLEHVSY